MAAARRNVFVEKVLKRLFPRDAHGHQERAPLPAASATPPKKAGPVRGQCRRTLPPAGGGTRPGQRLYTVTMPPEGYLPAPAPPEPLGCTDSESSSSSGDAEDEDSHDKPKRRRMRKHKSKKKCKSSNNGCVEQAELEKQQSLVQEKVLSQHTDAPTMSKNKKRKLKKKQQLKRKRAAGSLTRASGVSFLYEPREGSPEQGDASEGHAEDGEDGVGAQEDSGHVFDEKADGILDFLKSTQEMYFYDGISMESSPAFLEATEALFKCLGERSVAPADLRALDHMKTLLLLQDPEGLQRALQVFEEHCTMPPDHARVISAFFNYWITHVLPENTVMTGSTSAEKS